MIPRKNSPKARIKWRRRRTPASTQILVFYPPQFIREFSQCIADGKVNSVIQDKDAGNIAKKPQAAQAEKQ
jgi:hypothetical protein